MEVQHPKFDPRYPNVKQPNSTDVGPAKLTSDIFSPLPVPARALVSPSRYKYKEIRTSNVALTKDDLGKSSYGWTQAKNQVKR